MFEHPHPSTPPHFDAAILQAAHQHILDVFNSKHDPRLVYHNYQHTCGIVQSIQEIASEEQLNDNETEPALLAGYFSNIGYLEKYDNPLDDAIRQLSVFLELNNYQADLFQIALRCLQNINLNQQPQSKSEQVFADAVAIQALHRNFSEMGPLLRLEEELLQKQKYSTAEWAQFQLQHLMQIKFYLPYSKKQYEPIIAKNILAQKQVVEKTSNPRYAASNLDGKTRKFQAIERKMPNSATQTFFRANYRNHINLSAIADNKANIMISVNAIMISVLISVISYGNIMETRPMILMPVVIFLVSGLTSLIFAVLSARPKVTNVNFDTNSVEQAKRNIVFFGNFVQLDLEQYEEAMDAMFRDSELIYGNMTRDLYYLGKVLDKKYSYLTISYNVFMVGFAATVLLFLIMIVL